MDERQRKIRYGLILQGCVERALRETEFAKFGLTTQYDPDYMTPDFLIPDNRNPSHFIEVTQTEARDSFRMKMLRYFEAVCEAKAYFGPQVVSVNVLFGNPQAELPESNVKALYGFFDANLCPR